MTIKEMRKALGDTQKEFAKRYNIPFRTIQNWENGVNMPPDYVMSFIEQQVEFDLMNRRQFEIPQFDNNKKALPSSGNFRGTINWLREINSILGGNVVFALDSALACNDYYLGRSNEWLVWIYGDRHLEKYNGVYIIGENVNDKDVEISNGLKFTTFNRTLNDSLANERILDMQGITEALSNYYFQNNESFDGLYPDVRFISLYEQLCKDAVNYFSY